MDKPQFLYHGSCKGIENGFMSPRPNHGDINGFFPDGPQELVFATHEQNLATLYTLKTNDMLSAGVGDGVNFALFRDLDAWRNEIAQSPSKVYVLPSETFTQTIQNNTGEPSVEWRSSDAVQAVATIDHTPETVMQTGAQLIFLDKNVTKDMWQYDPTKPADYSFQNRMQNKINQGLLPQEAGIMGMCKALIDSGLMSHLNADTGINPIALQDYPYKDVIQEDIDWLKQKAFPSPERNDGQRWSESLGERTGWSQNL